MLDAAKAEEEDAPVVEEPPEDDAAVIALLGNLHVIGALQRGDKIREEESPVGSPASSSAKAPPTPLADSPRSASSPSKLAIDPWGPLQNFPWDP